MYDKQRTLGQAMPCEAEFRAYHLLTLIGTHGRYRYDATEYQGALAVSTVVASRQIACSYACIGRRPHAELILRIETTRVC